MRWREKNGRMVDPFLMTTNHLVYTLRMIFYHTRNLPYNGNYYAFDPAHYSPQYFAQVTPHLIAALEGRKIPQHLQQILDGLDWNNDDIKPKQVLYTKSGRPINIPSYHHSTSPTANW